MPGKSRHGRKKHFTQGKKSRRSPPAAVARPMAEVSRPSSLPAEVTPPARVAAAKPVPGAVQYPYIAAELRWIGILGGLMVALLVVLAVVLT